ncbi:hypothetical protein GKZ90_0012355 [Flavobacterium sp. MC2016-06]|jgi:hypothetical protein|uniref:hypothetical protein n=1 Tax=Flavobacterium sp. MC2016-06 TaxID=2676308 RepID=UPI0012BA881D|nr:hypothetical protein [Flavobacterium sp. MC2016-06]MBU3862410.1 hypothetical protein [Flavobacterium sp. MC2016-06]
MAIQTLNTIKNWFKTSLKPTQAQFWDTWDSFRHKNEKIAVEDIEGIEELLNSKTDESNFKTINGESILGSGDISIDGGGSGDLQQILDNGNIASFDSNHSKLNLFSGSEDNREAEIQISNGNDISSLSLGNGYAGLRHTGSNRMSGGITSSDNGISLVVNDNSSGGTGSILGFTIPANSITQTTYSLPINKPNGNYTLATLDDITSSSLNLEQILANGSTDSLGHFIELNHPSDSNTQSVLLFNGQVVRDSDFYTHYTAEGVRFFSNTGIPGEYEQHVLLKGSPSTQHGRLSTYNFPDPNNGNYILPVSVNGNFADSEGNITISESDGESQDLQSVLSNGNTATNNFINLNSESGGGSQFSSGGTYTFNADRNNSTQITPSFLTIRNDEAKVFSIHTATGIIFSSNEVEKFIAMPIPIDSDGRTLPLSVNGTYADANGNITISRSDEVSQDLQSVLNNGSTIQNPNIVLTNSFDGANGNLFNGQLRFFSDGNDRSSVYGTGEISLKFEDYKTDYSPEGFTLYKYSTNKVSRYLYPNPDGFTKVFTVSIDGNYANNEGIISTVAQNNTTTALSNSYLDATYSGVGTGFKVQCLNIAEGALTYEKTLTNWIQYAISIVTN